VCIEELEEDKAEEQHFVEAQIMHKDAREENIVVKEEHYP
jgi:Ser/Thr protein kinase RdoA (MazF antagonist)